LNAEDAAAVLAEIAYLLRHQEGQAHRARAFTRAATSLFRDRPDLTALRQDGRLNEIDGVGAGIARVLTELVDTGRSAYLERLQSAIELPSSPAPAPGQLATQGYRGDLHCHTDWSDGGGTVLEMALAARARGYEYLAITDHSPRITVVNGLGPERLAAQRKQIDAANTELDGLTLLQGIEVDILEDGTLDLGDETLSALDLVIASPHLKLGMEPAAMTERMLKAVENPYVHVIGHPTGRRPGSRAGATYDFQAVFRRAAECGTTLEMDCDPARMDLSPELAAAAAAAGCRLALDSDAHAPDQFVYVDLGLWMARRAGLEPERLLNWLPLAQLRSALR
jgi:putative hydrolase